MTTMAKYPCLTQRNGTYYVRKTVPSDIAESFGRSEVWRSLGTTTRTQALKKYAEKLQEIDGLFDQHRGPCHESNQVKVSQPNVTLDSSTLRQLCEKRYQVVVDEDFDWRAVLLEKVRADGEGFGVGKYIDHPRSEWYNVVYEELDIDDLLRLCVRQEHEKRLAAAKKCLSLADVTEHLALVDRYTNITLASCDRRKLARKLLEREIQAREDILAGDQSRYDAILEKNTPPIVQQPVGAAAATVDLPLICSGPLIRCFIINENDHGTQA